MHVDANQADQRQQRPEAQIKRYFVGGVIPVLPPAPHSDHDKGRHKRQLVEKVKEKQIHRGERTEDTADHEIEQKVKFLDPMRDITRTTNRRKRHHGSHENDPDVDAIRRQVKFQTKALHPGPFSYKLQTTIWIERTKSN